MIISKQINTQLDFCNNKYINMKSQGYLQATSCRNHKDYSTAKQFLNLWISDDAISFQDSCYYLNNYNHIQQRGGHRYARPSFAFKFLLKNNKKYFHKHEMEYCYHGTRCQFLPSIIANGLKVPSGNNVGTGIYSTKIPEYAQLYAEIYQHKGKYYQVILLLRQDLNKINCQGGIDIQGSFSMAICNEHANIKFVHLLHSKLMKQTDIQRLTSDESSIIIEAVLIKIHQQDPMKGQFREFNEMIGKLM